MKPEVWGQRNSITRNMKNFGQPAKSTFFLEVPKGRFLAILELKRVYIIHKFGSPEKQMLWESCLNYVPPQTGLWRSEI